ncbi:MAG: glycosyl transferase [Geminocystis sp.]
MDYKQELITTIHDFGCDINELKLKLIDLTKETKTVVLIPALYEEIKRPALHIIRQELGKCQFVQTVIICVYAKNIEEYRETVQFFQSLPQKTYILWENGQRITNILECLRAKDLDLMRYKGKGKAVWLGLGLATLAGEAIALHDADIITYDKSYPLKLLYPLVEKEFGIAFNKAYYARIGENSRNLNGRAVRLFVTPLLSALTDMFGYQNYLRYLNAFRYPLSGEFALNSDLALNIRIPANWGLEIGLLAEVYRNVAEKRISQIDLGIFDHKHQKIGKSTNEGLQKMCLDILRSLFRTLTETEQVIITRDHIHALRIKYRREAQDYTRQYSLDARFNGLSYDRHQEEVIIEIFQQVIGESGEYFFADPSGALIPDWTRALAVMPDLREQLQKAVNEDSQV